MKFTTLDLFVCPQCHLELISRGTGVGNFFTGTLKCSNCPANYPVIDGIPHLTKTESLNGFIRRIAG